MNGSLVTERQFVVATPARSVCDDNARVLARHGALRFLALGTRRGTAGVPCELTRLNPWIGLAGYVGARLLPPFKAETLRSSLLPCFDSWVERQLRDGDHVLSSYGYVNECFARVRANGGKTFLDAGNSHPEQFWTLLSEEHARWKCSLPPLPHNWYQRALRMMPLVDYVLSPSSYVTQSFLQRGFRPDQILRNIYPIDLSCFKPAPDARPKDRPLTVISTGMLSLRKGTPYMLEAFRMIHRRHPSARFLLTRNVHDSAKPLLKKYDDLPIDWAPGLPHLQLARRLQSADVFVLASLEEGLVRTALEAMACGLPVVLTPHTGAHDFIQSGLGGDVVPVRDSRAIADAVLKWADIVMGRGQPPERQVNLSSLSFEVFERDFIAQLRAIGLTA